MKRRANRLLGVAADVRRRNELPPSRREIRLLTSAATFLLCGSFLMGFGCSRPVPRDALVIAQSPRSATSEPARDTLDIQYPQGSRVIVATADSQSRIIRVLSTGLWAAGEPVVSYDAQRIVFAGKLAPDSDWQIYEVRPQGARIRPLTAAPGGAMDPALLSDGTLLFVSPVPKRGTRNASALYEQSRGGKVNRLTYSTLPVRYPTVLSDGRILFVSSQLSAVNNAEPGLALYTINNDGTEITAFAGQHDEPSSIHRPRQLADGRIVFVVSDPATLAAGTAETVSSARPFRSRARLLPNSSAPIRAVQPAGNGDLLVCAQTKLGDANSCCAVFRLDSRTTALGSPRLSDSDWNSTEAVEVSDSRRPMGRLSNVDPSHNTGQILCLDVNDSTYGAPQTRFGVPPSGGETSDSPALMSSDVPPPKGGTPNGDAQNAIRATRIRVFTESPAASRCILGEVEVQADGSFMAEVPADIPLGFEALDEQGRVLRKQPAKIWVRPGENRSCIGCHEPHNHSPRNFRPLAVRAPVPKLGGEGEKLAKIASAK
jgi:hypothetical protein